MSPKGKKPEKKKETVNSRFLSLKDDAFHPLTHEDIWRMLSRMASARRVIEKKGVVTMPDGTKINVPLNRPMDEWVDYQMRKHAQEAHEEIDAAVRDRINVKPGATLTPGNVGRYKELYESEMRARAKKKR